MNKLSMLSIKDINSNKKMTITIILSIIVVTILINSITTLALSYKEYIVNLSRSKNNWEAKFENVEYENIKYIEEDKNIKETSIIQDIGISNESYSDVYTLLLHIKAYDYNAMNNLNINLKEGRLPQNSNEIIINENMNYKIGDSINATINNTTYDFEIVGLIENTEFDNFDIKTITKENGAITLCDRNNLKNQDLINIYIITNNINKIYDNINNLENKLKLTATYNNEILSYACVAKDGSEFQSMLIVSIRNINRNNCYSISCTNLYNI